MRREVEIGKINFIFSKFDGQGLPNIERSKGKKGGLEKRGKDLNKFLPVLALNQFAEKFVRIFSRFILLLKP